MLQKARNEIVPLHVRVCQGGTKLCVFCIVRSPLTPGGVPVLLDTLLLVTGLVPLDPPPIRAALSLYVLPLAEFGRAGLPLLVGGMLPLIPGI